MRSQKKRNGSRVTRRTFMKAGAGTALLATSGSRIVQANDRVGVAFIGYGLRGKRLARFFKERSDVNIAAVAEVHKGRLEEAVSDIGGDVSTHGDFRKVLDRNDVQAVVVSTPDHWHALQTMMACAAGKDIYVEKPLTRFVREGRWMVDLARRYGRIVQVGTQQRSGHHYQEAREFIQKGRLGEIVASHVNFHRNIVPGFGNPPDGEPPDELDWEMFTGPAPLRAYNPNRGIYHFRWFWDYSGGQMTNWGPHTLDIVYWFLDIKGPDSVYSTGGRRFLRDNCDVPDTQETIFEFGKSIGTISIRECSRGKGSTRLGIFGTHGALQIDRNSYSVIPDLFIPAVNIMPGVLEREHPVGGPDVVREGEPPRLRTVPAENHSGSPSELVRLHVQNFIECIKSRNQPIADLEIGHRVATACHLANISLRVGRRISWNSDREEIVGDREASALLVYPYRKPWDAELRSLGIG